MTAPPSDATLTSWKDVLGRLDARDMPPKGKPRPTAAEYDSAVTAIRTLVERVEEAALAKTPRAMRRLNRAEYANTVRHLFGIAYRPGDDFPADVALHGFDTVADGLTLSPALVEKYLAAANAVLDRAFRADDPGRQPAVRTYAFHEEHHTYPKEAKDLRGFGMYNGNASLFFGQDGKGRVAYIGGPAVFTHDSHAPHSDGAFNAEGVYKLSAKLTPRKFDKGEVASFSVRGGDQRLVKEVDLPVAENGTPVVIDAEAYYDRGDTTLGFEVQWTNGNFLHWRNKKPPDPHPYAANNWFAVNHKVTAPGKWVEWKPASPDEIPFSYFEKLEFTVTGPFRGVPKASADLLGTYEKDHDAATVFERFLPRAFRRPVTKAEVERYSALVSKQREKKLEPLEALKVGMAAALCSPHFVLMVETPTQDAPRGRYTLTDHELAARLSYFLWSTCPDDDLRAAADAGKLREKATLDKQVARMLADPRAKALADGFARQWLNLDKLAAAMPEPKLFPDWSDDLRDACREETLAFFREVLSADRPLTDFLAADWTFLNERLAEHYGLPAMTGRELRKVKLPDARRGGLLTQAAVLTLTSEATRTAPVIRGAYVLDRLFHRPPPPPPANVGALIPDASKAKSVREHLAVHRADAACAGCHARFDGYGLALENFDATGRWRTDEPPHEDPAKPIPRTDGQKLPTFKIDAAGELADGSTFDGIGGLKKHLLSKKADFTRGLAERLTIYACGRGLSAADRPGIDAVVKATADAGDKFRTLIRAVVDSPAFRTR